MNSAERLITTYLQMQSRSEMRKAKSEKRSEDFEVRELMERNWKFNREMYFKVGESWKWIDKRPWSGDQWKEYGTDPNLRTFEGYCGDTLAGYYELHRQLADLDPTRPAEKVVTGHTSLVTRHSYEVEIAYFGLLPEFIGRGLGGALLTSAIENAWAWSPTPTRVWVHTCNRDHPSALANYQARGFKIYKVTSDT